MMVACPACDSRYDVDGYERGQQLRCRCGHVFAYEPPLAQAGALACPHCGAGVVLGDTKCAYCATELLLKACPRCLQRVFAGHKHCPECGAELALAESTGITDLLCPRCDHNLHARLIGDIVIDECGTCNGLFLDHVAVKRVIADRAQARAEALLGALPTGEPHIVPRPGEKMYVKCPTCRTMMNRKQFATGAGIIVDVCKAHGTFFDAGELPAIIEFVMNGGLESAAKKDLAREKQRLDLEREHVLGMANSALTVDVGPRAGGGEAMINLLSLLFR
jgi:Zn-finger nucleic acid-binding protein